MNDYSSRKAATAPVAPVIAFVLLLSFRVRVQAFYVSSQPRIPSWVQSTSSTEPSIDRPPCYYKSPSNDNKWKPRIELDDLQLGQQLDDCVVVEELLHGRTGPKVFCDCGVGRCRKGRWKITTAMLRLDRKESAARKRLARLRSKTSFTAHVSRLRPDNDQFEISLTPETPRPKKVSVSALSVGEEVTGRVVRLENYGAIIDVGANRHGLLHIQRVADLYDSYIDKAKGLREAGLEPGSRLRLQVAENTKKRLFLDFTDDVKMTAVEGSQSSREREEKQTNQEEVESTSPAPVNTPAPPYQISDEEAAMWASYNTEEAEKLEDGEDEEDEYYDEDDDDYDEDRDIEDALGLGTY